MMAMVSGIVFSFGVFASAEQVGLEIDLLTHGVDTIRDVSYLSKAARRRTSKFMKGRTSVDPTRERIRIAIAAGRSAGGKTRVRSEASRQSILRAALALLDESGYPALTIEAVAARAGAGKTTIYRHWLSLADLVLDAYIETEARHLPVPDLGRVRADLERFMHAACRTLSRTPAGKTMAALMAYAQHDAAFARRWRKEWIDSRRAALRSILVRGQDRGELRKDLDLELLIDGFYGPMWYRLLNGHAPLDRRFAEHLTAQLLAGAHAESKD